MNWRNVKLVWRREIRDQLRDRRTLLVICVLPLMIYPMMGVAFFRLSQFMKHGDANIAMVGSEQLSENADLPVLVEDGQFSLRLFHDKTLASRMHVHSAEGGTDRVAATQDRIANGEIDVLVYFPPDFAERLAATRSAVNQSDAPNSPDGAAPAAADSAEPAPARPPKPVVYFDSTRDESQLAQTRVQVLLDRWQQEIVQGTLKAGHVPIEVTDPFDVHPEDVATDSSRQAALWSKLLPFIVFICALTGAFYPAVDLCAGEKERGTLETLLTSPAQRSEIVCGKLLTVISFSIGSAICNLASMAITGQIIIKQLNSIGLTGGVQLAPPALSSIAWLLVSLVPMAALFSAMSLALGALARSTKEGQYYLMPLFLVCMPLMMLPLSPGVDLNFATSLIPITGMVLLMQAAMESKLMLAATYLVPVTLITIACCALAIRWAIDQFNEESVLFRDTENFNLASWIRYAFKHRPATPSLMAAAALVAFIFLAQFASQAVAIDPTTPGGFVKLILFSQLLCILLPTLFVAATSVKSFAKTFLLNRPIPWTATLLSICLACTLSPVGVAFLEAIVQVLPLPAGFAQMAEQLAEEGGGWQMHIGWVLLLMAVLPAICEELAFRGIVLSGLRSRLPVGWSIALSALVFGLAHASAVQQTASATLLGLVLGYIAVKTAQITPCVAFHMSYNGLQLLRTSYAEQLAESPMMGLVFRPSDSPVVVLGFTTPVVIAAGSMSLWLLWQIGRSCTTQGKSHQAGPSRLSEGSRRSPQSQPLT